MMKICSKCNLEKSKTEFHKNTKTRDGLRHWCKLCVNKDNSSREHKYKGVRKEYRDNNVQKIKQKSKIYYLNNREKVLKSNKNYRSTLHYKYISYKNSAKNRGIKWNLSEEQFEEFWNKNCHYCGSEIATIGIDRLSSSLGYTEGNLVPCCSVCNTIKMDLTQTDFLNHIVKIYNNKQLWEHITRSMEIL